MEIIQFELFGLHLQEPIALVTNWMLATFSFFAFFTLKRNESVFQDYWRVFYFMLGLSTFFGGLGHLFFQYTGIPGKFPSWSFGIFAGIFSSFAMISIWPNTSQQKKMKSLVLIKSFILLAAAVISGKFFFVAVDTTISYLVFCGYMAYKLHQKNYEGINYIVLGVIVLLPSAFIFGLKINLHHFLNKDDLSHLFMGACISCFYFGIKKYGTSKNEVLAN